MKIFSLSIFLIALLEYGYGQKNYIVYHQQIVKAESAMMAGKYDSCLKLYNNLFIEFDPFAKDCLNTLQISLLIKNENRSLLFFRYCFRNGITMKMVESIKNISTILNSNEQFNEKVIALFAIEKLNYFKTIDWDIRINVDIMRISNGYLHEFPITISDNKKFNVLDGPKPNLHYTFYQPILDANTMQLVNITNKYGFPGENKIGICSDIINTFTNAVNSNCRPVTDIIFYHNAPTLFMLQSELL
jgi:hypothetical protein